MKTRVFAILAIVAGACTSASDLSTVTPAPAEAAMHVRLQLRGIATSAYQNVLLDVKDVRVLAAGRALEVKPGQVRLDLADTSAGYVVGEVDVPAGVDTVQVAMTFDDFGGFQAGSSAGDIDARTVPVVFAAKVTDLAIHGKAVVQLDVSRSLIAARADRRVLLPSLSVAY